jgi:pimeloyl-ACP methyl ester carboxylesterase
VNRPRTATLLAGVGGTAVAFRRRRAALASWVQLPDAPPPALSGRVRQVVTPDGVSLHVEEHGPRDAGATLVLAHGYVQSNRVWDRQVAAVCSARPDLRVVTYDQRGHGASGRTPADRATLQQLGQDLLSVLDTVAPSGPVVVGGHSMGGMTVMSLVEQHPGLVGPRIVGAALVGTSPGRLAEVTYGLPALVARLVQRQLPRANERARSREEAGKPPLANGAMRWVIFGKGARPGDVARTLEVMARCSAHTVADFHVTFTDHDRLAALSALATVPVLIVVGTHDRLCPVEHSREMARALPHAQLVLHPGAGHMVQLERDPEVSQRLVELCAVLPLGSAPAPGDSAPAPGVRAARQTASASRSFRRVTPFSRSASPRA